MRCGGAVRPVMRPFRGPAGLQRLPNRMYATESPLVRWFRAVDEPVSKPKKFNYKPAKPPSKFEAFAPGDSARLEHAFARGRPHELVETDGLVTVHFANRVCTPTYYDGPAFAVRRALWFEKLGSHKLGLADEGLEAALEAKFREDGRAASFCLEVPADAAHKGAKPRRFQGSFSLSTATAVRAIVQEGDSWLSVFTKREFVRGARAPAPERTPAGKDATAATKTDAASARAPGSAKATRGFVRNEGEKGQSERGQPERAPPEAAARESDSVKQFTERPPYTPRDVNHLIFCVHGIGQLLSLRYEQVNFVKDVDQFRRGLNKAHTQAHPHSASNGIQVLPVMWRHGLDDMINGLHPQQLFGSVNVAADVVLDFVMYMEEQHRRRILHTTAEEMRRMYAQFCENNPEFAANPKVSIVGHSLGSVIAHDLVSRSSESLPFDVTNLFTMGSPVGILELMRHADTIDKGRAASMYNILRRADPVAARLEPIVVRDALDVAPQPLPGGGTNLLKQLKDFTEEVSSHSDLLSTRATAIWNTMMTRDKPEPAKPEPAKSEPAKSEPDSRLESQSQAQAEPVRAADLAALQQFNRHGRLDFSVTETMDISLVLGLAGHLMYLDNEDIAAFVLRETLHV